MPGVLGTGLALALGAVALWLGLLAGVAAVVLHHTTWGMVLAAVAAVAAVRALRLWNPTAATAFTAGWVVPLLVALAGRAEGDYAVSADGKGYVLVGVGVVVFVTGLVSGPRPRGRHDSGSEVGAT
jgi:hypothetical protein